MSAQAIFSLLDFLNAWIDEGRQARFKASGQVYSGNKLFKCKISCWMFYCHTMFSFLCNFLFPAILFMVVQHFSKCALCHNFPLSIYCSLNSV